MTSRALSPRPRGAITTIRSIIAAAARHCETTTAHVIGRRRDDRSTRARFLALYVARRRFPTVSFSDLGQCVGGRDHTTVMHAVRSVAAALETEPALREDVAAVEALAGVGQ